MGNNRSDRKIETAIGYCVRILVVAAACVVTIGGVLYLGLYFYLAVPAYGLFHGESMAFCSWTAILKNTFPFTARSLIQLGILFLIAIPAVRVIAFAMVFAIRRDWLYCAISGVVCAVLLFSFFGGRL
jgi:uncharacterized membrane protein